MPFEFNTGRDFKGSRKWNVVLVAVGLALALVPLRATPQASVQDHSWWVWRWWLPSIALLAPGVMRKWPGRRIVLVAASLMYFAVYLLHPVCDEIPEAVKGNFETVRTLEERARQGEPFRRLDGRWYQCKSWLARQLFF